MKPSSTICWECKNALWLQLDKNFKPVAGWKAVKTTNNSNYSIGTTSYKVVSCPEYTKG